MSTVSAWRSQQTARYLKAKTIHANEIAVRRFSEHSGCWPSEWRAPHVDEYFEDRVEPDLDGEG